MDIETVVDEYLTGYTLEGDEGSHTPTDAERFIIKDAIMGLLANEEWTKHFESIAETYKIGVSGQRFKHLKTGNVYEMICEAIRESDGVGLVVYRSVPTDTRSIPVTWVRPTTEFFDGRFSPQWSES